MTFCIFSFNRGRFLHNCITSIEQCVDDAEIVIFDDQSDDPDTVGRLRQVAQRHQVILPSKRGDIKHGGLYHNMQAALEHLHDRPMVCLLQDDTQLVRPVPKGEITELAGLFADAPKLGFVHPCFFRGYTHRAKPPIVHAAQYKSLKLLTREDQGQSAGVHYSDLHITSPGRLLNQGWHFQQSEPENNLRAKTLFEPMHYMHTPFAMWLPEVPAYRGKKKTWALKVAEKKKQSGFYPFSLLSTEETQSLKQRSADDAPIAEAYLSCQGKEPVKPWTYNPLSGHRWLKHLNNVEVFFHKQRSKIR